MAFQYGIFYGNLFFGWLKSRKDVTQLTSKTFAGQWDVSEIFFLDVTIGSFSIAMESGPFVDALLIEHLNLPEFF